MCGIAGIFDTSGAPVEGALVERMNRSIAHRGPDGDGVYLSDGLGLGHRRLAIIDLSEAADQPMANEDGTVVIVFNGEIYNYLELRSQLAAKGHVFDSRSDTEVVVHGYEEWGADVVHHLNGMFAFALWDARERRLFVARDRYGIKPLYYTFDGSRFIFGSEIKALLEAFEWRREVDAQALVEYFSFQNVLSDRTLFSGIRLFPAACRAFVELDSAQIAPEQWWDFRFDDVGGTPPSFEEASEEVRRLVETAVKRQLMSDVPLGSYLSGGMDSGSLVAIAARSIPHLMTFTGGFELSLAAGIEMNFDERAPAEQLASIFGTDHYEMVMHAGSMERVLPQLVWHLEDLRVGMSYQNYYIAHLASRFVRVVLSGGGGDELFGGYPWRYLNLVSTPNRAAFDEASHATWLRLISADEHQRFFSAGLLEKAGGFSTRDVFDRVMVGAPGGDGAWSPAIALDREMYFEAKTFLHGLLIVEDKISSAHALEARVPFLDNELTDFVLSLPAEYKVNLAALMNPSSAPSGGSALLSGDGKFVLRNAMRQTLPEEFLTKRKQGFSTPDASWYRGHSMDYIKQVVLSDRALARGYFSPERVRAVVAEHAEGARNHRLLLWSLLSFEWWNRVFIDGDAPS
jgi:asparagine synthase (glutamine-hydrolysing)